MEKKKQGGFYYGWVVFAVCFLMVFVSLGFGSSTKGTYLTAITESLNLKRGLFTINDSMRYITTAILSFFFGHIVMKIGPRKMVGAGFAFLITSFTIYSFSTTYWQFYIGGAFLGAGICWTTTTIVGYIVENWFTNAKGTIMGIILAANGLGGVASEQIITRIIYGMDGQIPAANARWRLAYRITAILFAVTGVIVVAFLRNKPSDMGLKPYGQDKTKKKKRGLNWVGYELKDILKMPCFYVSGACVFFTGFILQSMTNVSKPYMYDVGLSKEYVLYVFSAHALVLAASKVLTGICYDKYGIRVTFGICSVAAVVSVSALCMITPKSTVLPWVYSIISSFGMPLETVVIPLLVSQMFGQKSFSKVMGYYLAANTLGYACGVPIVNTFYDIMGTYKYILIALAVIMAIAAIVAQFSMAAADRKREKFLAEQAIETVTE